MGVGITEFHVFQAATRLVSQGVGSPTIKQVRQELGNTGSTTTITKHMQTWRARYLAPEDNAGLPSPVLLGLSTLYQELFKDAPRYTSGATAIIPISYPFGDFKRNIGVCTDVVIRSLRPLGIDLQSLLYEDIGGRTWELRSLKRVSSPSVTSDRSENRGRFGRLGRIWPHF